MPGDIQIQSYPGGARVLRADPEAAISLDLIAGSCTHVACAHLLRVEGDLITVAEQVVYRVVGYADRALQVVLVEDLRREAGK